MSDKPDLPVPADIAGLVEETTIGLSDLIEQESYEILPWVRTALRGVRQNVKTIVATLSRENAAQAGEIKRLQIGWNLAVEAIDTNESLAAELTTLRANMTDEAAVERAARALAKDGSWSEDSWLRFKSSARLALQAAAAGVK